jgi:VanZ family protein
MKCFLKYWLPLLIWLAVMLLGSTDLMSAEHTSRMIVPFLRWLKPDISPGTVASIHTIIRKCAHVSEYAILALLSFRALIYASIIEWSAWTFAVTVWIACILIAATDELHQSFVPSRTSSGRDVLIDGGGATLGLLIGVIIAECGSRRPRGKRDEVVDARF